jgi:hypothetical protein
VYVWRGQITVAVLLDAFLTARVEKKIEKQVQQAKSD